MSLTEKIDVLDLIINVLKEHEKKLDELIGKLEILIDREGEASERNILNRFYEPI